MADRDYAVGTNFAFTAPLDTGPMGGSKTSYTVGDGAKSAVNQPGVMELSVSPSVSEAPVDPSMSREKLSKADWQKLGVVGVGGTIIGLAALISPVIPLGAMVVGVGFALFGRDKASDTRKKPTHR